MAKEIIFQVEESPEGGFEAWALGYSIFTEADTLEELRQAIAEAVRCHFDSSSASVAGGVRFLGSD
ncbi:MAG: 2-oxoisovalerate dehydrogenase [Candidatus Coatesbacteria bacterium]|nr:2-oxoisovalerate dehydrogenase [Candidatus Coatesbacteria bacterium]